MRVAEAPCWVLLSGRYLRICNGITTSTYVDERLAAAAGAQSAALARPWCSAPRSRRGPRRCWRGTGRCSHRALETTRTTTAQLSDTPVFEVFLCKRKFRCRLDRGAAAANKLVFFFYFSLWEVGKRACGLSDSKLFVFRYSVETTYTLPGSLICLPTKPTLFHFVKEYLSNSEGVRFKIGLAYLPLFNWIM